LEVLRFISAALCDSSWRRTYARLCVGLFFYLFFAGLIIPQRAGAQETPYFVTYSHHLEEPGNLEIELSTNYATQTGGDDFIAPWVEFEYGVKAWWTSEFYLDSQGTFGDSALFTGFRWENRFRPLMREHWINPVLYVEYENTNGADKTMIEVVGFDTQADHAIRNAIASKDHQHELETKLILSSDYKGWNISENHGAHARGIGRALNLHLPYVQRATPGELEWFLRNGNVWAGMPSWSGLPEQRRWQIVSYLKSLH